MATAVILDNIKGKTESIFPIDYSIVEVRDLNVNTLILDDLKNKTERIFPIDYSLVEIKDLSVNTLITEVLPFRVKFTAIQIQAIGLGNTPGIGLQVIGYSNYIL